MRKHEMYFHWFSRTAYGIQDCYCKYSSNKTLSDKAFPTIFKIRSSTWSGIYSWFALLSIKNLPKIMDCLTDILTDRIALHTNDSGSFPQNVFGNNQPDSGCWVGCPSSMCPSLSYGTYHWWQTQSVQETVTLFSKNYISSKFNPSPLSISTVNMLHSYPTGLCTSISIILGNSSPPKVCRILDIYRVNIPKVGDEVF